MARHMIRIKLNHILLIQPKADACTTKSFARSCGAWQILIRLERKQIVQAAWSGRSGKWVSFFTLLYREKKIVFFSRKKKKWKSISICFLFFWSWFCVPSMKKNKDGILNCLGSLGFCRTCGKMTNVMLAHMVMLHVMKPVLQSVAHVRAQHDTTSLHHAVEQLCPPLWCHMSCAQADKVADWTQLPSAI